MYVFERSVIFMGYMVDLKRTRYFVLGFVFWWSLRGVLVIISFSMCMYVVYMFFRSFFIAL